ncbi:MAG: arylesterase [Gammaproteobacteria bacterium]|nr:arylesterase [Gammaproteobacteria bacterium]
MRTLLCIFLSVGICLLSAAASATPKIVVLGDSLSSAYGIEQRQGWVALLQQRLRAEGHGHEVVNASITGDTTRGGLTRLPATLERERPAVLIIELGGNDGLRGLGLEQTRDNLHEMIAMGRSAGARLLLLGVRLPQNYGRDYGEKFHRIYLDLAGQHGVALVPFFLAGVAETRAMMQPDGIHPGAEAQPRILDNIWPQLVPLLQPGE